MIEIAPFALSRLYCVKEYSEGSIAFDSEFRSIGPWKLLFMADANPVIRYTGSGSPTVVFNAAGDLSNWQEFLHGEFVGTFVQLPDSGVTSQMIQFQIVYSEIVMETPTNYRGRIDLVMNEKNA